MRNGSHAQSKDRRFEVNLRNRVLARHFPPVPLILFDDVVSNRKHENSVNRNAESGFIGETDSTEEDTMGSVFLSKMAPAPVGVVLGRL